MPWQPQHDQRDREIASRVDAGERVEDVAAEYELAPRGVRSVLRRLRARDQRAEHAKMVLVGDRSLGPLCPVHRPVVRLSVQLMAEIAAAKAEMDTAPIYRGGW